MRVFHKLAGSLVLSLFGAGCEIPVPWTVGSGNAMSEAREVPSFTAISINDSIAAEITLAPDQPQAVEVSGDDNIVPLVQTWVSAGKLVVGLPPSLGISPKVPLVVTISATALRQLEANDSATVNANLVEGEVVVIASADSSQVTVEAVVAEDRASISAADSAAVVTHGVSAGSDVSIAAEDSATVEVGDLAALKALEVTAEDSSVVTVQGSAPHLDVQISDSSELDAAQLTAETVVIEGADSSVADVCATVSLDATLSDSSAVSYGCDPEEVTQLLDDSSTLTAK